MRFQSLLPLSLLALAAAASATEGMWPPSQLPQIAKPLRDAGLQLDPRKLTQLTDFPMGAVVSLGGCTASFVSPQGLVVTNHHCAYSDIQFNSTPQNDLLEKGFNAATLADEVRANPSSRIYVTVDMQDVSSQMLSPATQALRGKARALALEATQKSLVSACEKDAGHRCNVARFFGGLHYQLIKQLEIRDVRLVHAPAKGVGLFGGDTDNWVWPRHTGDYSFLRAYVGPDGKPADFSPSNKPYQPKHHLKLASSPLNEGDFAMVTGYPGGTDRHRLPSEVDFAFGTQQPQQLRLMGEALDIIKAETANRRDAEIKLANRVAGLANYRKNLEGQQASYDGGDILARKQASFAALKAWVQSDAARRAQFATAIGDTERLITERQNMERSDALLNLGLPTLLGTSRSLIEWATQRALPDAERKPGLQDRDAQRLRQRLDGFDRRYDEATDKRLVQHFLQQYLAQPEAQLNPALLKALGLQAGMAADALKARLDALYAGSQLSSKEARMNWMGQNAAAFQGSSDSFIAAAAALYADDQAREARLKEIGGELNRAYAGTMQALIAFKASQGQAVYPDANGTLRISFGKVEGRDAADGARWNAFTTLRGIVAKHTGKGDFDAPKAQLEAIKAQRYGKYAVPALGSVPVNFLATVDTTGGNSGSPVLNKKGEFVGLLFDGTLDAVIADWDFNPKMVRSICVDARYMLWQMSEVDKATRLLAEMGVR